MFKQRTYTFIVLSIVFVIALACNLPSGAPAPQDIDPLAAAQLTVTAAANQNPAQVAGQVTPSFTPLATLTSAPAFTETPAFTPTSAFTPTPSFSYVILSENTNCRTGPGKVYDLVDTFTPGQTIEVIGKNPTNEYWYVRSPNNGTEFCWLWGFYATGGNLGNVGVLTPPSTPTPAPNFEVSYAGLDTCVGWWVELNLKNTGAITFKSMSISVRDTVTDVLLSDFGNGFTDMSGCLASGIVATLDTGQSYTVSSPAFAADPTGHKIKTNIKLCTENNLGGQCIEKNLEFKP